MTGLLILLLFAGWGSFAIWVAIRISQNVRPLIWRWALAATFSALLLVSPLFDELLGARQFSRLCQANDQVAIATSGAGPTVYLAVVPDVQVANTWVPVRAARWRYVDVRTGTTVVSYDTLSAGGGWLSRILPLDAGHGPISFKGFCRPQDGQSAVLLKRLHLTQVQRSQLGKE
jgi:hypothetical protein